MKGSIYGLIVGDALGVPVEFTPRHILERHPVSKMTGWGTHNQPPGTWSDDSSLMIATMDSISQNKGLRYEDILNKFARWLYNSAYTATGSVFDVGRTTANAIRNYISGVPAEYCGETDIRSNGNGSLMRILPVVLFSRNESPINLLKAVHKASALTHRHPISLVGCGIYALIAVNLMKGMKPEQAISVGYTTAESLYSKTYIEAFQKYRQIKYLTALTRDEVSGSGYVVDTLVASLWCLLHTSTYRDAVLKAVNLGRDTDTVGAVTGSLAGMVHQVPVGWIKKLQNLGEVNRYVEQFSLICT